MSCGYMSLYEEETVMTKLEFLQKLEWMLSSLPREEVEKSLQYYSEMIDDYIEEGISEAAATERLDPPEMIAQRILAEFQPPMPSPPPDGTGVLPPQRNGSDRKALTVVLLILGFPLWFPLLIAFGAVLLAVYIVIWSLAVVLFALVLSFGAGMLAGLFSFFMLIAAKPLPALSALGIAFICAGLAIFTYHLTIAGCKMLVRASVWIFRQIKSLFVKRAA